MTWIPLISRVVSNPVALRKQLTKMGPVFIKVGQYLALQPDLVEKPYRDELMQLLDQVPEFSPAISRQIIEEDLCGTIEEIFGYFRHKPIGSGSIAQTHYARLHDGKEVAIKVLRPGIQEQLRNDFARLRKVARLLETFGAEFITSPKEVVEEIIRWLQSEIDFKQELRNVQRLKRLANQPKSEVIPNAYAQFSTERVLTIAYIKGLSFSDILQFRQSGPEGVKHLTRHGYDLKQLASNLIQTNLNQIFRYQYFHADLHPGNLFAMAGNAIGYVDFGLCDQIDETVKNKQLKYLQALYEGKSRDIYYGIMEVLNRTPESDEDGFKEAFYLHTDRFMRESQAGEQVKSIYATWMVDVMRSARTHKFSVPARVLSMYRALLTAESVAHQLDPEVNLGDVGREFFKGFQIDEIMRSLRPESIQPVLLNVFNLFKETPGMLLGILTELAENKFAITVNTVESKKDRQAGNKRAKMITVGLISVGVAVLLGSPTVQNLFGAGSTIGLGATLGLLWVWLFIQIFKLK